MPKHPFDLAVIGGGVVGCAVARRFTLEGASVVLVEKSGDILAGASKGNTGLLHSGFDAPSGSLELACMLEGRREYLEIKDRLGLPAWEHGAVVVAWDERESNCLDAIEARARLNGVEVRRIGRRELFEREPHLAASAREGLFVPGEAVIDPWSTPLAYLRQAVENGAETRFHAEVRSGTFRDGVWKLETPGTAVFARTVINCAGLYGDIVNQRLLGASEFTIHPRKGQFIVFDKVAAGLVRSILLPVPTEQTKGVVVTRTIFGNVLVGPTAGPATDRTPEAPHERERAGLDSKTSRELEARAYQLIPSLKGIPVRAAYAGLRPATERPEYRIAFDADRQWITAGGIRSTGLTSALGIAKYVFDLYKSSGRGHTAIEQPVWPRLPNLAEHQPRDWDVPGSEIICHCEMVTRREIEAALRPPMAAADLGGIKRRTRATMGRCQGLDCAERITAMLKRSL